MSYIKDGDFALEVSLGNVTGYTKINKFGCAPDADSGVDTDIWDGADGATSTDIWVPPTTARTHDIVSTDANDDGAPVGTGMRTIRIYGLTAWNTAEVSEDIILNGTTNVATANSYVIIHRMKGLSFGSVASNVGIITATAQTDGTVTAVIQPGMGQTLMSIYGVPSIQTISIVGIFASILKSGGGSPKADMKLLVDERADQSDSGFLNKELFQLSTSLNIGRIYGVPKTFAGPCIIKMQVNTDTINSVVTAEFDAYVVDN